MGVSCENIRKKIRKSLKQTNVLDDLKGLVMQKQNKNSYTWFYYWLKWLDRLENSASYPNHRMKSVFSFENGCPILKTGMHENTCSLLYVLSFCSRISLLIAKTKQLCIPVCRSEVAVMDLIFTQCYSFVIEGILNVTRILTLA